MHKYKCNIKKRENLRLSPALMEMARLALKEFEAQSDEAFLIRAEMDRKLTL